MSLILRGLSLWAFFLSSWNCRKHPQLSELICWQLPCVKHNIVSLQSDLWGWIKGVQHPPILPCAIEACLETQCAGKVSLFQMWLRVAILWPTLPGHLLKMVDQFS